MAVVVVVAAVVLVVVVAVKEVRFQVVAAMSLKMTVAWNVT
jgi:hypothetical protein